MLLDAVANDRGEYVDASVDVAEHGARPHRDNVGLCRGERVCSIEINRRTLEAECRAGFANAWHRQTTAHPQEVVNRNQRVDAARIAPRRRRRRDMDALEPAE